MSNIWFTSDTHFNHNKSFLYEPRGFSSIVEHDIEVVRKWNEIVKSTDIVYHLGDIGMGKNIEYLCSIVKSLNGNIKWILGNHCTDNRIKHIGALSNIEVIGYADKLKISRNISLFLCHYPTLTMPRNLDGKLNGCTYSLCGHTHTKDRWLNWDKGGIYHVELDAHNCYPVSLEEVRKDLYTHN